LLEQVRDDPASRQEFLDLLETLGPEDPRTSRYRKALSTRLF
jgi:putative thioredoxin